MPPPPLCLGVCLTTYMGSFIVQYVVLSVSHGLLGRQPDRVGSWGAYCSWNWMYLQRQVGRLSRRSLRKWNHTAEAEVGLGWRAGETQGPNTFCPGGFGETARTEITSSTTAACVKIQSHPGLF